MLLRVFADDGSRGVGREAFEDGGLQSVGVRVLGDADARAVALAGERPSR